MRYRFRLISTTVMLLLGSASTAQAGSEDVVVKDAWSRASIGTSRPGVVYMEIRNMGGESTTLTGLSTSLAKRPEIHRTSINDKGMSSMEPAGEITIGAGETVALEPGGLHAMLMGLQAPMSKGDSFPLTLLFADGGKVEVEVPVLGVAARGPSD